MSDDYEFEYDNDKNVVIRSQEDITELFKSWPDEPLYKRMWWAVLRAVDEYLTPRQLYKRLIKWPVQRSLRGFDDRELWNLESTFTKFIIPRLKAFRSDPYGCPSSFVTNENEDIDESFKAWNSVLSEMIWAFEFADNDYGTDWDDYPFDDEEKQKILSKRYESGMQLFAKYYSNLWQ